MAGSKTRLQRLSELRARGEQAVARLDERFGSRPAVAAARKVIALDQAIAGGELAGALAYRLFLWFLPFILLLVAGLGVYADAAHESPKQVAARLGLAGLVIKSVAAAAKSDARWYALLIGVPVLLYVTRNLLRTLVAVERLAWGLPRERGHLTPRNVLVFLVVLIGFLVIGPATAAASDWSGWSWFALVPGAIAVRGALWLALSLRLPNRAESWTDLVPGAVVVGVGIAAVNVFTLYVVAIVVTSREDTYGSLGTAAAVLLSLWATSRVIVLSADVNAAFSRWRADQGDAR